MGSNAPGSENVIVLKRETNNSRDRNANKVGEGLVNDGAEGSEIDEKGV